MERPDHQNLVLMGLITIQTEERSIFEIVLSAVILRRIHTLMVYGLTQTIHSTRKSALPVEKQLAKIMDVMEAGLIIMLPNTGGSAEAVPITSTRAIHTVSGRITARHSIKEHARHAAGPSKPTIPSSIRADI